MATEEGYGSLDVISLPATPPLPPALEQPAPYAVSYGAVSGVAAPGSRRLVVRVGGRVVRDLRLARRRFSVRIALPTGETTLRVETVDGRGRRASRTVSHVFGLPPTAEPRERPQRHDSLLAEDLRRLVATFPGTSAVYVQSLTTGAGAAWNAKASFPAASSLKLAIAVTALARVERTPAPGSRLHALLREMLVHSDNAAANDVERYVGGSTSGGAALVNVLVRSIGLVDTEMYGGYEVDSLAAGPIPARVDSQPAWGTGKRTSAADLAGLARAVWLASGGKGPLRRAQPGFSVRDARYLLYLLAHVRDPGKLDREIGRTPGVAVLHKAGWLEVARHDNGLVFWRGGVFVATVMTYRPAGAGVAADALAGRVAATALRRFRG